MPDRSPLINFPFGFFPINPETSRARFFNRSPCLRGPLDDHAAAEADT